MNTVLEKNSFVFLDGAMGTMLQKTNLDISQRPEVFNITSPDEIIKIHKDYIDSGAEIIYTNTFGANRFKLAGTGYSTEEIVKAAVDNALTAAKDRDVKVALDIGPLGEMMEPSGPLKFETAYETFKEIIIAGASQGADLIIFETMTDLYELKAAILAASENSDLPILTTMTFEANGRTFTGVPPVCFAKLADRLGVTALGVNCSLGPVELYPIVEELSKHTNLPLIVKANAGLPDPVTGKYDLTSEVFADAMSKLSNLGVKYFGGCCGTDPVYISEMKNAISDLVYTPNTNPELPFFSSSTRGVFVDDIRIVGERINPTGKADIQNALKTKDLSYILREAALQAESGASVLDVNAGFPDVDEAEMLPNGYQRNPEHNGLSNTN